jgi:hypothetical protein
MRLHVDDALIPNFFSFLPRVKPSIGFGTTYAFIPCKKKQTKTKKT